MAEVDSEVLQAVVRSHERIMKKRKDQEDFIISINSMTIEEREAAGYAAFVNLSENNNSLNVDVNDSLKGYLAKRKELVDRFETLRENYERHLLHRNDNLPEGIRSSLKGYSSRDASAKSRRVLFEDKIVESQFFEEDVSKNEEIEQDDAEKTLNQSEQNHIGEDSLVGNSTVESVEVQNEEIDKELVSKLDAKKAALIAKAAHRKAVLDQKYSHATTKPIKKSVNKSNIAAIQSALKFCIYPGVIHDASRKKALSDLEASGAKQILALFRGNNLQYRGLYTWDQQSHSVEKISGVGPAVCDESMIDLMFKYDYGGKSFSKIPAKHFEHITDGFTIADSFWLKPRKSVVSK